MEDALDFSASRVGPAIRSGRVSQAEYVGKLLARYDADCKFDGMLVNFKPDELKKSVGIAVEAASPASPRKAVSPSTTKRAGALAGVPFAITPNVDVIGLVTNAGTSTIAAAPDVDAAVVSALKGAGATLIGQANMAELNLGAANSNATGIVKNPFSAYGTAGGAASGAAALVASRIAPVGLGVDSVGDLRVPAALCGVVGYRPTQGRYSAEGLLSLSHTLDTAGFVARTVHDIQLLDAVVCAAQKTAEAAAASAAPAEAASQAADGSATDSKDAEANSHAAAAVKMQAAGRGFLARKRMVKVASGEIDPSQAGGKAAAELEKEREAAAARIQALARGKADRKQVSRIQTQQTGAESRLEALTKADDVAHGEKTVDEKAAAAAATASLESARVSAASADVYDAAAGGLAASGAASSADDGDAWGGESAFVKDLAGVRLGIPRNRYYEGLEPGLAAVVEQALTRLAKAGAVLVEIDFPATSLPGSSADDSGHPIDVAVDVIGPIQAFEAPRELAAYLFTHVAAPEAPKPKAEDEEEEAAAAEEEGEEGGNAKPATPPAPKPLDTVTSVSAIFNAFNGAPADKEALLQQLKRETATSSSAYRSALVYRRPALKRIFTTVMRQHKLVAMVYPTTPLPSAPLKGTQVEHNGQLVDATSIYTRNTKAASAAGLPALSVPCGMTKPRPGAPAGSPAAERLPVGLEFIAAPNDDERLLSIGRAFQRLQSLLPDPIVMRKWASGVTYPHQ